MGGTSTFLVSQNSNASSFQEALVQFTNIVAEGERCQLELDFPAAYEMTSDGDTQMNIWTVKEEINGTVSWLESPKCDSLFGTAIMQPSSNRPTTIIINSVNCKPVHSYRITMAGAFATGTVMYTQGKMAGFKMRHCSSY
ncbi:MAG: hypothetical protein M1812_002761 [Candelaria pacifica]|nr:MAG: hypothetical protein M1812_002761 [Candelaria pacifica]